MKRFLGVTCLAVWLPGALLRAEEPNDQFVRIYQLIQQADALNESGRGDQARQKYLEAQGELQALRKTHPDWNESVVRFRLNYVAEKLKSDGGQPPAQAGSGRRLELPAATGDSAGLIQLLREKVRELTADNERLEAKLKEALTAQPAAVDPRELARAEERIKALEKEVEVLKVSLAKAESKPDKPVDPAVLEAARQALAGADRKLAEQTDSIAALRLEKEALQKRLQPLLDGAEVKTLREENEALKRKADDLQARMEAGAGAEEWKRRYNALQAEAATQKERGDALAAEKKILEEKLTALTQRRDADLATKTRALEKELAAAKATAQSNAVMVSALQTALKEAQREKAELETQRNELEARLARAQAASRAGSDDDGLPGSDARRGHRREQERGDLGERLGR